jgi:hypothetical protein
MLAASACPSRPRQLLWAEWHPHGHLLATDGGFSEDGAFHPLQSWDADTVRRAQESPAKWSRRSSRFALYRDHEPEDHVDEDARQERQGPDEDEEHPGEQRRPA